MEKVLYLLMGQSGDLASPLGPGGYEDLADAFRSRGGRRIQINVTDPSLGHPFGVEPDADADQIHAVVSMWVNSVEGARVAGALPPFDANGWSWAGYLVTESEPTPLPPGTALGPDGRLPGFAQMVALSRPSNLSWAEWRRIWQGSHTAVAINTQSTLRYVQNVVVRPLTPGAPPFVAVVEECFPIEAVTDLHVFFDAVDDDAKLDRHMAAMSESCDRFMDGAAPVTWTIEYQYP
jgi:hypothetical protein